MKHQLSYPDNVMFVEIKMIAVKVSKMCLELSIYLFRNQIVKNVIGRPQRLER